MPIRAERKALYPKDWKAISLAIREREGWRCGGSPAFPHCRAENGKPHPVTGSKVVLTVAHLDHDETSSDPSNLRAMCQKCHLAYDAVHHRRNAAKTRRYRMPQIENAHVVEARARLELDRHIAVADHYRKLVPDLLTTVEGLREVLFRLKAECEIDGLDKRAGFDCWVSLANEVLAETAPGSEGGESN